MRRVYAGVLLTSLASIVYEVVLTRIIAFKFFWHFSYLIISVALLGFGAAGAYMTTSKKFERAPERPIMAFYAFCFAVASLLGPSAVARLPMRGAGFVAYLLLFFASIAFVAIPFFFSGMAIGAAISKLGRDVNRVYFYDLVGAALGCVVAVVALNSVGAVAAMCAPPLLAAVASLLFDNDRPGGYRIARLVAVAAFAVLFVAASVSNPDFISPNRLSISGNLFADPPKPVPGSVGSFKWCGLSRVDVTPEMITEPRYGGLINPDVVKNGPRYGFRLVLQDLAAPTAMFRSDGDLDKLPFLLHTSPAVAFLGKKDADALVIGPGGGTDVMTALKWGAKKVVAVEINPAIYSFVTGEYSGFIGDLYKRPDVKLVNDEGRGYLERSDERFDVITLSGVDTYAALSSGAYSLSENYLYTVEGMEAYLARLKDDGVINITRHLFKPPRETLRLMAVAVEALRRRGIADPSKHLFVMSGPYIGDFRGATLALKKDGFSTEEAEAAEKFATTEGFEILHHPYRALDNEFSKYASLTDAERLAFADAYIYNISPATDDSPFFFQYYKWGNLRHHVVGSGLPGFTLPLGHVTLIVSLAMVTILSALFILRPMWKLSRAGDALPALASFALLGYFAALGAGFMAIEIVLMQKLTVFLGFPLRSLTVVLFALLLSTGTGSLLGGRMKTPPARLVGYAIAAILLLIPVEIAILDFAIKPILKADLWARIAVAVCAIFPLGFAMGLPFPTGIKLVREIAPGRAPLCWGTNACFSVVGSLAVVILSMNAGFRVAMIVAGCIYALGYLSLKIALARAGRA